MTRVSTRNAKQSEFPWDMIVANTLRQVCQQLGLKRLLSKAGMVAFLQSVQNTGLERASEELNAMKARAEEEESEEEVETQPTPAPAPAVRKPNASSSSQPRRGRNLKRHPEPSEDEDEAEQGTKSVSTSRNTRFKGTKRVRVTADPIPTPSRSPRKSTNASRRRTAQSQEQPALESASTVVAPPKRKRGRPRKNPVQDQPNGVAAASTGNSTKSRRKEVFAGVVLPARRTGGDAAQSGVYDHAGDDADAEGEEVDEMDELILLPNDDTGVASSLASSNKENEFVPPDPAAVEQFRVHNSVADAINSANLNGQL